MCDDYLEYHGEYFENYHDNLENFEGYLEINDDAGGLEHDKKVSLNCTFSPLRVNGSN